MSDIKPITLSVLKEYFTAMSWGDVPDYPTALYSMLLMDGYISKASAATEVRSSLATQHHQGGDVTEAMVVAACDEFVKHYGHSLLGLSMQKALSAALAQQPLSVPEGHQDRVAGAIENIRWVMQNLPIDFAMHDECPTDRLMHALGVLQNFTPATERYQVVEGSQSGHCCFDFTVVDTTSPVLIHGKHYNNQFAPICECFEKEDADRVALALNGGVASI